MTREQGVRSQESEERIETGKPKFENRHSKLEHRSMRRSGTGGNPLRLAFLFAVLSLGTPVASAQVVTGLPPFGSFSGGPDVVNNANLNVHIEITVLTKAGRGLPFYYILTYDSSVWYPSGTSGSQVWAPSGGWGTLSQPEVGSATYGHSEGTCTAPPHNLKYIYDIYSKWVYYDSLGAPHPLASTLSVSNQSTVTPSGCSPAGPPYNRHGTANDGSGYTLYMTADPAATAYSRSGTTYQVVVNGGYVSATDTNGNKISYNGSSFVDTLWLTALTIAGSPPNSTTLTYTAASGNQATVTMNYTAYTVQTNFGCSGITEYPPTSQNLVSSIGLPDGTSYNFTYEVTPNDTHNPHYVTGRIASVQLPIGGTIYYSYSGGSHGITCADGSAATLTRTTPDGAWSYAHSESGTAWTTTITDPQNNQTTMNFQTIYETERQVAGLGTVFTCYNNMVNPCTSLSNSTAITLPITYLNVTPSIGGLESEVMTTYNSYGLPTEMDEYGYGSGAVGPLVGKTTTAYNTSLTNNIYDRPSTISVYNGSGTLLRQGSYSYDGGSLTSTSGTPQHSNPSGSRGNLTSLTVSGYGFSNISNSITYYDTGNKYVVTDFHGAQNTFNSGTGACGNSFDTTISLPLSLSQSLAWNCNGALKNSVTDLNINNSTTFSYDDMNRLIETSYPDGGLSKIQYTSATVYDFCTLISGSLTSFCTPGSGSLARQDETVFDGLGRTLHQDLLSDPAGETYVDATYDSLGRLSTQTNPYRSTSDPSYGYDTYSYDALNRVTKITHKDGAYGQVSYGSGTQTCSTSTYGRGYPALYTDESGNQRRPFTDALGRVVEVDEPDPTNGNSLTLSTCYAYDAQGNLTSVVQGSQTRSYSYDGLSRLTQLTTPEGGTTHYYYTTSGGALCANNQQLVCRKTDARSITTTYAYDALDRLTSKTYSDSTPPASFSYDQSTVTIGSWSSGTLGYPKGRMTEATTTSSGSVNTGVAYSYDPVGRIKSYWQCNPSNCGTSGIYNTQYNYDLAGDVNSWTHPGLISLSNSVNSAQQVTQVQTSSQYTNLPQTLVQNVTYTPWGAVSTFQNGCVGTGCVGAQETYDYNNRLQPVRIQLGTPTTTWADYCQVYNYYGGSNPTTCAAPSQGSTGNNGNVMGYLYGDSVDSSFSHSATYTYDNLNRLATAVATPFGSGTVSYNLTFNDTSKGQGYDRYGNMTCVLESNTNGPCPQWSYNTSTNQLASSTGCTYDAAGHLTKDCSTAAGHTYQWDAEGRVSSVDNGALWAFTYNALGHRVQWSYSNGAGANQHMFDPNGGWLGIAGALDVLRWGDGAYAWYTGTETYFNHINNISSTTVLTKHDGTPAEDILYYPWGQTWQLWGGGGANFAELPYGDANTNTNLTLYRHQSPGLGRWLSPDPLAGDITNPQSLNLYPYVMNNPTTSVDPLGLANPCPTIGPGGGFACTPEQAAQSNVWGGGGGTANWDEFDLLYLATNPTALVLYYVVNAEGGPQWGPNDPGFENEFGGFLLFGSVSAVDLINLLGPQGTAPGKTTRCVGNTRAMAGNPSLVGRQGGVPGTTVTAGSTAAIPSQWGGIRQLSASSGRIVGLVAVPRLGGLVAFKGVTDTVGSSDVPNVQAYLQNRFPGDLILELNNLPKADDPMVTGAVVGVPDPMGCPAGTKAF